MYNPFKNFSDSLKNTEGGWSGRKTTAFALTLCVIALHVGYFIYALMKSDFSIFTNILIIDLCAIAFFLGLVTVANLIELKTGNRPNEEKKDLDKTQD